jgi:transcription elongation factor Elf1
MTTRPTPLKRAIEAAKTAMAGERYGTQDKRFQCLFCGNDRFKSGPYAAIISMHTLICADCGHVEFFAKAPKPVEV